MHEARRQTAEQSMPQRIEQPHNPAIVFPAIEPDEYRSTGLDCPNQALNSGVRIGEVMDDANAEGDVKGVGLGDLVNALLADLKIGKVLQILPCSRKGPVVDVHGKAAARAIGHRPIAVAAYTATAVEKPKTPPEGTIKPGPAQKLLF